MPSSGRKVLRRHRQILRVFPNAALLLADAAPRVLTNVAEPVGKCLARGVLDVVRQQRVAECSIHLQIGRRDRHATLLAMFPIMEPYLKIVASREPRLRGCNAPLLGTWLSAAGELGYDRLSTDTGGRMSDDARNDPGMRCLSETWAGLHRCPPMRESSRAGPCNRRPPPREHIAAKLQR